MIFIYLIFYIFINISINNIIKIWIKLQNFLNIKINTYEIWIILNL